jgi:predicted nucleotidyltransferase
MEEIVLKVRQEAQTLAAQVPSAQWYLFGSVIRGVQTPTDIDLLIVYKRDSDAHELRKGLEPFSWSLPLHLLLLRTDEESELQFVKEQRAMCIFPTRR